MFGDSSGQLLAANGTQNALVPQPLEFLRGRAVRTLASTLAAVNRGL
jgi:hypothetical protein